ncbi:DUF6318 family protein [Jonesia denitrificans]|uniref:DUF6318 domain-containing protein n=1 Tax=Jonesia denitrificans (strain ATCC 14870 / DSM 20603 / BCRC 15368 / CIP 55.134 / JCM 11481 / NBRC 15587 / NCTC 10816 / Prevot 55134) TaxID=471856 RepID=C7R5L2_JONDD|nr:DUF6318 family protein [Jonesia denitrificans]ACV09285.1 hypothetical protein Jden_1637 [Jonesia denitrificans DSM 20603]ASE10148.1 hypothetical protein CEP80_10135 [Jonesia denitrificans]QXB43997.1 hypothetical protein I6L70_03785 [Jonesia denitrificans]SQH21528.1 Uncharacterised protein [Jonesia denitrificans]
MSVSLLRGRTVRRVLSVLVVAGLLGAGATGCSNDAGAKTENTVDASPTPTNTPTDGEGDSEGAEEPVEDTPAEPEQRPVPEEPEAMKTGDKAGAIAAATFFVEVIEYDATQPDSRFFSKYAYEECGWCNEYKKTHEQQANSNFSLINTNINLEDIKTASFAGEGSVLWSVPINANVSSHYKSKKDDEVVETEHTLTGNMLVGYRNGQWLLVEGDLLVK